MTSKLRVVQAAPSDGALLVLGTNDVQAAWRALPAEIRRNGWGGSFPGWFVRRGKNAKTRRWTSRTEDRVTDLPKDAKPGVLFTSPDWDSWSDRHGDVWRSHADGLMHSYETRPFPREHVEKKWGPLRLIPHPCPRGPEAHLEPDPTTDPDDHPVTLCGNAELTVEDAAAVADFAAFLRGGSACVLCMTPDAECPRAAGTGSDGCCPHCEGSEKPIHRTLDQVKAARERRGIPAPPADPAT